MMVNLLEERFLNEGIMANTTFTGNAIATQKNRTGFLIFDEDIKKHMETAGYDFVSGVFKITKAKDLDHLINDTLDKGQSGIFAANSLGELADKAGIDPQGLKETVEQYNRFCEKGHDDHFN
jgi:fumarate reductase flavoprotein subunit